MATDFPSIPGYTIEKELGQGGMGVVYLAVEEALNRKVAIKVIKPGQIAELTERDFQREAKLMARLEHASIVPVYYQGKSEETGGYYLVMRNIDGGALTDRIRPGGLGLEQVKAIMIPLLKALAYAHSKGVVHRDIKPANILFDQDETPLLVDFGIAKLLSSEVTNSAAGSFKGTPAYMSPEQVRGARLDGQADLYSLGIVFYELLTGTRPYATEDLRANPMAVMLKHLHEPIPTLPMHLTQVQFIVDRLLAKDPQDRYPDAKAVLADLVALQPQPVEVKPELPFITGCAQDAQFREDNPVPVLSVSLPKQDMFETPVEYAERVRVLRTGFCAGLEATRQYPVPAGQAFLREYRITHKGPPVLGGFELELAWKTWIRPLLTDTDASAMLPLDRDAARALYQTGKKHPLYVVLGWDGQGVRITECLLYGLGQAWHVQKTARYIEGKYILYANGTALDTETGLMWMRCALGQHWDGQTCEGMAEGLSWDAALRQAPQQRFAGYTDWRLPTLKELQTLLELNQPHTKIHPVAFPQCPASCFWSALQCPSGFDRAWYVNFELGIDYWRARAAPLHVRLVRGGLGGAFASQQQRCS